MEVIELDTGNCTFITKVDLICPDVDFDAYMMSLLHCISDFGSTFSGVLTDERGRVQAIWGSFSTQVSIQTKKNKKKKKKKRKKTKVFHC
jgi:hypothetical protein